MRYSCFLWICILLIQRGNAGEWLTRQPLSIGNLSILNGQEYPIQGFDPPLYNRADGEKFVNIAVVDNMNWVNLALNSLVSLEKHHPSMAKSVVVVTMSDSVARIFESLGFYVFDARSLIQSFPDDFQPAKRIPYWSWGEFIFLRFNIWVESFRRKFGFCSLDLDVTYNQNIFFSKSDSSNYADIVIQGNPYAKHPSCTNECSYYWVQFFREKRGYYVNPGLGCHTYNAKTMGFMKRLEYHNSVTVEEKKRGWGQLAYVYNFCEFNFEYGPQLNATRAYRWEGVLKKNNATVLLFNALSPQQKAPHAFPQEVPAYHAKACHGNTDATMANSTFRTLCKEEWLQKMGQWYLPPNIPRSSSEWDNAAPVFIDMLKSMLFGNMSTEKVP